MWRGRHQPFKVAFVKLLEPTSRRARELLVFLFSRCHSSHHPISCRASPHIPEIPREIPYRTALFNVWQDESLSQGQQRLFLASFRHSLLSLLFIFATCLFEILSHLTLLSNTGISVGSCLKRRLAFDRDVLSQFRSIAYFPPTTLLSSTIFKTITFLSAARRTSPPFNQ